MRTATVVVLAAIVACKPSPPPAAPGTRAAVPVDAAPAPVPTLYELVEACDPAAIAEVGARWQGHGRALDDLQTIIDLARPSCTGRWDLALPFLAEALRDLDDTQRAIDGAVLAADALGEARLPESVAILGEVAAWALPPKDPAQRVRLVAIVGLGKSGDARAVEPLTAIVRGDPAVTPMALIGAAVNALGELHRAEAVPALLEAMYRSPLVFQQVLRALVGLGPDVKAQAREILRGEHAGINALFAEHHLDTWCDPAGACQPVSTMAYYAAILIGDLHDDAAVPDLVGALAGPARPAYYDAYGYAGPPVHNAILDALRRIGAPEAAPAVLAIVADVKADPATRAFAANVYAFVSPRGEERHRKKTGLQILSALVTAKKTPEPLRLASAEALGRLGRSLADARPLQALAAKYAKTSTAKRKQAEGKPRAALDAAQAQLDKLAARAKKVREAVEYSGGIDEDSVPDPEFVKLVRKTEAELATYRDTTYDPARDAYDALDQEAKSLRAYERTMEEHLGRIEVAARCAGDVTCLAHAFEVSPDGALAAIAVDYAVVDETTWTPEERQALASAQLERAILELRRLGVAASDHVPTLLDAIARDTRLGDRLIRQAVMLTLPRIAALPCDACVAGLDVVIAADAGRAELTALDFETRLVASYFAWAGR